MTVAERLRQEEVLPDEKRNRARLAVAVLNGKVTARQAGKMLGMRTANAFPSSTWSSLRRAVAAGLVRVEWIGDQEPLPDGGDRRTGPRRFPIDAPPKPEGKKSDRVREAIEAFPGNFTAREIHERVNALHPEAGINLNRVCQTIAQLVVAKKIRQVATEERDGSRRVRVYCQRPDPPPTNRQKGKR